MKLEQSFTVKAPIEEVWAALTDVPRVAPCLPGAEITEASEDGTYQGNFQVKLGPTTAAYRGTLKMEALDEEAHVATMSGVGQDKRGQGSAKASIVSTMTESAGETTVDVVTDFTITGRLARFGRGGMIKDISNRLLREFADCLQRDIESGDTPPGASAAAAPAPSGSPAGTASASPTATASDGATSAGDPQAEIQSLRLELAALRSEVEALKRSKGAPVRARKPIGGISLVFSVLAERVRRRLGGGG